MDTYSPEDRKEFKPFTINIYNPVAINDSMSAIEISRRRDIAIRDAARPMLDEKRAFQDKCIAELIDIVFSYDELRTYKDRIESLVMTRENRDEVSKQEIRIRREFLDEYRRRLTERTGSGNPRMGGMASHEKGLIFYLSERHIRPQWADDSKK